MDPARVRPAMFRSSSCAGSGRTNSPTPRRLVGPRVRRPPWGELLYISLLAHLPILSLLEPSMDETYDIFLSYASEDRERVRPLIEALDRQGWSVWWDRNIPAGRTWSDVIDEALEQSRCVVVVWTSTSVRQNWVLEEAEDGLQHKHLFPVFLDDIQAPRGFRRIQGARLQAWDGSDISPDFQRLHADLVAILDPPLASEPEVPEVEEEPAPSPPEPGTPMTNRIGMAFVRIPAGDFHMGSAEGDDDERPVHSVRISQPFDLGIHPVTQAQWETVMGNNPSHFTGDANRPVESVSWEEVQAFIAKLRDRDPGVTYRLPTEAEWEYAARAGSTTAYCFGNDPEQLSEYAWYGANSGGTTHPVGQRKPNDWGLYDIHGNVWEWVQDWYNDYPAEAAADSTAAPTADPTGPSSGSSRVYRGGSWHSSAGGCRSANRTATSGLPATATTTSAFVC